MSAFDTLFAPSHTLGSLVQSSVFVARTIKISRSCIVHFPVKTFHHRFRSSGENILWNYALFFRLLFATSCDRQHPCSFCGLVDDRDSLHSGEDWRCDARDRGTSLCEVAVSVFFKILTVAYGRRR